MDAEDKGLLNEIQSDFPVSERPYLLIAERLGLDEDEVIRRVGALKAEGVIRRIGASFNSSRLSFSSTLCAARVPEDRLRQFVSVVNEYPGVTHNYRRNGPYNIWFTLIAKDHDVISAILQEIADKTGVSDILDLPAVRTFKIKVNFEV
jgi:DNA-binding Lrp family transcriptional regulator